MALARTSPIPFSVARSFSEAVLMSLGSFWASALLASAFGASAFGASFLASAGFAASAFGASFLASLAAGAWANAIPIEATAAISRARNLFIVAILLEVDGKGSSRGPGA